MMFFAVAAALVQSALSGHVAVRMPFLNPAGVTYAAQSYQAQSFQIPAHGYEHPAAHPAQSYQYGDYDYSQQFAQPHYGQEQYYQDALYNAHDQAYSHHAKAPVAVGYAQVPVKAAVAVPTVHHVKTVTDVPVTKIEHQPAVIQKIVDVAKPALKTRKYEVRRPAIQKQFYDIEERTIIRPVGSALVELDEPLFKGQKGPAVVTSVDDHHHHQVAVTAAPAAHVVAVTPAAHVVDITPTAHLAHGHFAHVTPAPIIAITPPQDHIPYAHHAQYDEHHFKQPIAVHDQHFVSTTPAPIHYSTEAVLVSSTPVHHHSDDSVYIDAAARNVAAAEHAVYEAKAAHQEAVARAHHHAHLAVEAHSNGAPHVIVENHAAPAVIAHHHELPVAHHDEPEAIRDLKKHPNHEAQENQKKLLHLLTARGGVAEVGFGRAGHAEHVGDAGITRARVLSATPSPHHEPVEEKVKTRRIVVSHPVQTLQEIDVVEPVTKVEQVAVNQPTVIKTARLGYERVESTVPVYGKAFAPAIAHAQVPVQYYHK